MEQSNSLLLNEEALNRLTDSKKPVFIFEWLRYLDQVIVVAKKSDIKEHQKKLVDQLLAQIQNNPGPPTRRLIARCLATIFSVGDTFLLFDAVNKCNDILKNKDDSPSYLPTRLSAITCIGAMYEKLGRMMGRSYEETVGLLLKSMKNAESQTRYEIYLTLEKIVAGLGNAAGSVHRDIFKSIRHGMVDRVMVVRSSAAKCLAEMIQHAPFLYTSELENVFSLCFRSLEGSNYEVRCSVAFVLGRLVAITQQSSQNTTTKNRLVTLDEALNLLASGFLRGGIGFLKSGAGEMIKGTSSVSRETRVGVTHAYVVLVSQLGNIWLERNMNLFLSHLLDLLANPKSSSSHMDAVYSRKCVSFVLRSVLGKQLGEKQQAQAIKELVNILSKYINAHVVSSSSNTSENVQKQDVTTTDIQLIQHVLVSALLELGCLIESLGTSSISVINDPHVGLVDTVASVVAHPSPSTRLAAAWCMRCIAVSTPSQLTPLIERCLERLETMKSNPETINGFSAALSALLGSACQTQLGIPHNKGKLIFNIAEDLLRTASQNSRLSLQRTQAGWLLIGAVMTLGPPIVKGLLPRMLLLWKNSFPRSSKELESEKARGDAFTWQITLENRAGALAAMSSFLTHCNKLATEEVIRRMLTPIESALLMLAALNPVFKNYSSLVKASCAMVRLRLYETLLLLPPHSYDSCYTNLLRILVAEFTLTENASNTTTSLLRSFCHSDDDTILGSWLQDSDHKTIEDQLQPNSLSGSGAIEHDTTCLYKFLAKDLIVPGPLPLGVAVIDKSTQVFAAVFPFVAHKHRVQMLNHFQECIKHSKSARQEAVQMNTLTAILGALKTLVENKTGFGTDEVRKTIISIILNMLNHSNPIIRCAAAESLGKSGQVINDGRFVAEMAQQCFDKLKSSRDALSRTGHSLALGCLHRYVGSLGSSQHLNTSISILLALAQDATSPTVQVWALHALTMIADSGGPMFKSYVEPTLSQCLKLLLTVPMSFYDVHQCIGKCLSAMITTIGPELQANTNSTCATRSSLLVASAIMQEHNDFLVQAEAISCLQQMHMFAPKHVNLETLVPVLCNVLRSPHLLLRRAAVSCLHQLSQREAREVLDHVYTWTKETKIDDKLIFKNQLQGDHGLAGILFAMLDHETDSITINNIHKIVTSIVHSLATDSLGQWLNLCKEVLTAVDSGSAVSSPDKEADIEDGDAEEMFKANEEPESHSAITPRWTTRVFATQTLCKIINTCENSQHKDIHFDLATAREKRKLSGGKKDYLVLHLSDLIRMSFIAATSDSDALRMEGLKALQLVIDKFATVPEPEFKNHVILEQYQAQVGAALRPAFSHDTPPHVTAMACQVCSAWIGSGVARDLNDLRRVHQLLVSSLTKLQKDSSSRLYNESASTIEKLAILKAWAEVYVVAMTQNANDSKRTNTNDDDDENLDNNDFAKTNLLQLVTPELVSLSKFWLSALKDHALLTLPAEFASQLPHDGGAFYTSDTIETARPRYRASWPPILHAAALWLCSTGFDLNEEDQTQSNTSNFHLLFGICIEALCNPKSNEPLSYIIICLKSLQQLISHPFPESIFGSDLQLAIELCNVLHRLLLTREAPECQILVLEIAHLLCKSQLKQIELAKKKILRELVPANQEPDNCDEALESVGEGQTSGELVAGQSLVYSLLEVCLCVLIRQLPQLSPSLANTPGLSFHPHKSNDQKLTEESAALIAKSLSILSDLPLLCSPKGSVAILPSIMYLMTGVLKECAQQRGELVFESLPVSTVLNSIQSLGSSAFTRNSICRKKWIELLQSTLASILDWSKTSSDEAKPDEITTLLVVGVFIMKTPADVTKVPNLQYPCINLLKQALQNQNEFIQFKCIETIKSIFQNCDSNDSIPYIHALAPRLIELLNNQINQMSSRENISKIKLDSVIEIFNALEVLIGIAPSDKRINIMNVYLPLLISLLSDGSEQIKPKSNRGQLHAYVLQKITSIGPKYPQEFRQIVSQVPTFKSKLENAIRNQQSSNTNPSSSSFQSANLQRENPSIKLKVDFSNYVDRK